MVKLGYCLQLLLTTSNDERTARYKALLHTFAMKNALTMFYLSYIIKISGITINKSFQNILPLDLIAGVYAKILLIALDICAKKLFLNVNTNSFKGYIRYSL